MSKLKTKQKICVHHWIIDSPDDRTSFGKCIHCGAVKEFSNDWQDVCLKMERPPNSYNARRDV